MDNIILAALVYIHQTSHLELNVPSVFFKGPLELLFYDIQSFHGMEITCTCAPHINGHKIRLTLTSTQQDHKTH